MNESEKQIRKIRPFNYLLLTLTLVTWVAVAGAFWVRATIIDMKQLKMNVTGTGELRFYSVSSWPYIITHLVYDGDPQHGRITAVLPRPLLFDESGGIELTKAQIETLKWLNAGGKEVTAPDELSNIRAIYYTAQSLST